jgi:hypothetical protein
MMFPLIVDDPEWERVELVESNAGQLPHICQAAYLHKYNFNDN